MTMDGIGSFECLTDLDFGAADVQVTWISRASEVAAEVLANRSLPMPADLRRVSDNAYGAIEKQVNVFLAVLVGGAPQYIDKYVAS